MNDLNSLLALPGIGGPYEDESGGEDLGGPDDLVFAGGADDDEDGGPSIPQRLPAIRRARTPQQAAAMRTLIEKCRRGGLQYQHPTTPRNLGSNSHVANIVHKNAPNKQFGLRFLREAGCTITSSSIPVEARSTPAVSKQILRNASYLMPQPPLVQTATVAALPTFGRMTLAVPPAGERNDMFCFALRLDFGLQGLFVPAASPVSFDVFSKIVGGADPTPGAFGEHRGISTDTIILTPWRNMEAFTVLMLFWNTIQTLPHPRMYDLYNDQASLYGVNRATEVTVRISTAPNNTNVTATLLTPTHPSWQKMIAELGC